MIRRIIFALVLVIFIAEVPAFGQEKGTTEIGAFGKAAFFDKTLNYSTALGGGGRAGYYFFRNLMLEGTLQSRPHMIYRLARPTTCPFMHG